MAGRRGRLGARLAFGRRQQSGATLAAATMTTTRRRNAAKSRRQQADVTHCLVQLQAARRSAHWLAQTTTTTEKNRKKLSQFSQLFPFGLSLSLAPTRRASQSSLCSSGRSRKQQPDQPKLGQPNKCAPDWSRAQSRLPFDQNLHGQELVERAACWRASLRGQLVGFAPRTCLNCKRERERKEESERHGPELRPLRVG